MQGQEAIFSFKVLKSSAYKDARALQVKRKWCLKLKNYPLYNIDIDIGYDFKVKQVLVLVLNSKKSGNQQIFDFEPKPTFIAQLCSAV